jgi:membrane protein
VSPGANAATILRILGSPGFTQYHVTYGSLGGAVIMLTWLYLSAFGAVVNTQIEQRAGASPQTSERFNR